MPSLSYFLEYIFTLAYLKQHFHNGDKITNFFKTEGSPTLCLDLLCVFGKCYVH